MIVPKKRIINPIPRGGNSYRVKTPSVCRNLAQINHLRTESQVSVWAFRKGHQLLLSLKKALNISEKAARRRGCVCCRRHTWRTSKVSWRWSRKKGRLAVGLDPQLSYCSLKKRSNRERGKRSQRVEHWSKSLASSSSSLLSLSAFSKTTWKAVKLPSWEAFPAGKQPLRQTAGCCLGGSLRHTALQNRTKETLKARHSCHASSLWKTYARAFLWMRTR